MPSTSNACAGLPVEDVDVVPNSCYDEALADRMEDSALSSPFSDHDDEHAEKPAETRDNKHGFPELVSPADIDVARASVSGKFTKASTAAMCI